MGTWWHTLSSAETSSGSSPFVHIPFWWLCFLFRIHQRKLLQCSSAAGPTALAASVVHLPTRKVWRVLLPNQSPAVHLTQLLTHVMPKLCSSLQQNVFKRLSLPSAVSVFQFLPSRQRHLFAPPLQEKTCSWVQLSVSISSLISPINNISALSNYHPHTLCQLLLTRPPRLLL